MRRYSPIAFAVLAVLVIAALLFMVAGRAGVGVLSFIYAMVVAILIAGDLVAIEPRNRR